MGVERERIHMNSIPPNSRRDIHEGAKPLGQYFEFSLILGTEPHVK